MKTIQVPISWVEGLENALDKCEFLRHDNEIEELSYLFGYLDSIREFIKTK